MSFIFLSAERYNRRELPTSLNWKNKQMNVTG